MKEHHCKPATLFLFKGKSTSVLTNTLASPVLRLEKCDCIAFSDRVPRATVPSPKVGSQKGTRFLRAFEYHAFFQWITLLSVFVYSAVHVCLFTPVSICIPCKSNSFGLGDVSRSVSETMFPGIDFQLTFFKFFTSLVGKNQLLSLPP